MFNQIQLFHQTHQKLTKFRESFIICNPNEKKTWGHASVIFSHSHILQDFVNSNLDTTLVGRTGDIFYTKYQFLYLNNNKEHLKNVNQNKILRKQGCLQS